ncbi:MAG TPA: ECF transporter S component [Candidatus Scatomonas merdavium]|nr:ECF transporter S component [Candidatus Scatomonas merdavium]
MNTRRATVTALMAALVFLGTYIFKIPSPFGGYAHLGDCMIILSVCLLGTGHAVLAAAIGAGLADLLGGYMIWVVPTAVIKGVWALLMGLFMYRILKNMKFGWLAGAVIGGLVQIVLYTIVKIPLYGQYGALAEVSLLAGQTVCGIVFGSVLYLIFEKSSVLGRLQRLCRG